MLPRTRDHRLTRESRECILHGLMQGCVKALNTGPGREAAAALCRDLQPGQPAGDTAAFGGVKPGQRGARRERGPAGLRLAWFKPAGKRTLGESIRRAEGKFCDSGGHKGSRVSWPWKITKPPRILNGRYPFVKPFVKV